MSAERINRRRRARAIAISVTAEEASQRIVRKILMAGAGFAALCQAAWLVHATMRMAQP